MNPLTNKARPLLFDVGGMLPARGRITLRHAATGDERLQMLDVLPRDGICIAGATVGTESQMASNSPVPVECITGEALSWAAAPRGIVYTFELMSRRDADTAIVLAAFGPLPPLVPFTIERVVFGDVLRIVDYPPQDSPGIHFATLAARELPATNKVHARVSNPGTETLSVVVTLLGESPNHAGLLPMGLHVAGTVDQHRAELAPGEAADFVGETTIAFKPTAILCTKHSPLVLENLPL